MNKRVSKFRYLTTFLTIFGFLFTQINFAYAQQYPPQTFGQLYQLAANGDLSSIKQAISKGLNINSLNGYGNTGLCESILRGDYTAYDTFYAAGANPNPACLYQIDRSQYQWFMASKNNALPIVKAASVYEAPKAAAVATGPVYGAPYEESSNLFGGWFWGAAAVGVGVGAGYLLFNDDGDDKNENTTVYINPCEKNPCGSSAAGSCSVDSTNPDGYKCSCSSGYRLENGTCVVNDCDNACNTSYQACNTITNVCEIVDGKCLSSGDCSDPLKPNCVNNTCSASTGTDACAANPCGSSAAGTCSNDGAGGYTCSCSSGYRFEGGTCVINDCGNACNSSYQTCNTTTNLCELMSGKCEVSSDCPVSMPVCTNNTCSALANPCDAMPCGTDSLVICTATTSTSYRCGCNRIGYYYDASSKSCKLADCDNLCDSDYQTCNTINNTCELTPGKCGSSSDCSDPTKPNCLNNVCSPDTSTDPCASDPCGDATAGTCSDDGAGSYTCACNAGYTFAEGTCKLNTCDPACDSSYQSCNTSTLVCEYLDGKCDASGGCDSHEECNLTTNTCELKPDACYDGSDCESWESCSSSFMCELDAGRCNTSADCTDPSKSVCDGTNTCVAPVTTPCTGNPCGAGGTCNVDGSSYTCSCTGSYYVFDSTLRTCVFNFSGSCGNECGNNGVCFVCSEPMTGVPAAFCQGEETNPNAKCACPDKDAAENVVIKDYSGGTTCEAVTFSLIKDTPLVTKIFDGSEKQVVATNVKSGEKNELDDVLAYVQTENDTDVVDGELIGVKANVETPQTEDTSVVLGNISLDNYTSNNVLLKAVDANITDAGSKLNIHLKEDKRIYVYNKYSADDNTPTAIGIATSGYNAFAQIDGSVIVEGQNNAYGVFADDGSVVLNNGEINVFGNQSYGMYANNNAIIINKGKIAVNGDNSYGMYADNATLINTGNIEIVGDNSVGIKAINSSDVLNTGSIMVNDVLANADCNPHTGCGNHIQIDATSTFTNNGVLKSDGDLDLSAFAGRSLIILGKDSQMIAENEISGSAMISSSVVLGEQKDVYTINNAFSADNVDVSLYSQSAMFDAQLVDNGASVDAQLSRIAFADLLDNQAQAQYLESGYGFGHSIYDSIMVANSTNIVSAVNDALGISFISNFAQQNMDLLKSINYNLENAIAKEQDFSADEKLISGYFYYTSDVESTQGHDGYRDHANTLYAFIDKKYNNNFRYGFGATITQLNSDYDKGSTRDEDVYQLYALLSYKFDDYTFVSIPSIGLGVGEYERVLGSDRFEADTTNYFYSLSNSLRKDIEFENGFIIEPLLAFNVLGVYQGKTQENNQLEVDAANNVSAEVGAGLYLKRSFKIDEEKALSFRVGGIAYYELIASPFASSNANIHGISGYYVIDPRKEDRDRHVLNANVTYTHMNIDVNFDFAKYLNSGTDDGYSMSLNVKYNF